MNCWPGDADREQTTFGGLRRGQLMARVRSVRNRTTELRLALLLRRRRIFGWRRHLRLPGKPDFSWRKQRLAVFVDGCFWHGHHCGRNVTPKTNANAWRDKIRANKIRDCRTNRLLRKAGWTVIRLWECSLSGNPGRCLQRIERALTSAPAQSR